jgi:hypothetical protein
MLSGRPIDPVRGRPPTTRKIVVMVKDLRAIRPVRWMFYIEQEKVVSLSYLS